MRLAILQIAVLIPALAAAQPSPVHLVCEVRRPDLCAAISESLGRAGGREVDLFDAPDAGRDRGYLTVRFSVESMGPTHLSGRLTWTRSDGTTGTGPVLELSVTDATLSEAVLGDYASALVAESAPPL